MANITKKKNRRLKRQVRKTIGALLMASAIGVAAVPVQDVEANIEESTTKVALQHTQAAAEFQDPTITQYKSQVPSASELWVDDDERVIYTTGDGRFQFTYMRPNSTDTNKYAVILGYNGSSGDNSTLTIPDKLIAYKKYSDNVSSEGYCLVSKNGGYLYYEDQEQKTVDQALIYAVHIPDDSGTGTVRQEVNQYDPNINIKEDGTRVYLYKSDTGEVDPDTGQPIFSTLELALVPVMETIFSPCYYEQRGDWETIRDEDLYYRRSSDSSYVKAGTDNQYWKIIADVAYIGNDVIKSDNDGGWEISGTGVIGTASFVSDKPSSGNGVFKNAGNVQNLIIGGNIWGIGDYAFSGCSNLQSVTLGDNLQTIGNGAFANCIRLNECNIKINARLQAIGKDAFYNCPSLKSFTTPINLAAIGDSCFEGCTGLQSVELGGGDGGAVALTHMGDHVFKNCSSLSGIEFPVNYTESKLDIDMFEGCSSLQYIKINNSDINFSDFHSYDGSTSTNGKPYPDCKDNTWESFKETVPESFYFEGPATSNIHTTATNESVAFKYLNQDLYEKIEYEHDKNDSDPTSKTAKVTYQVNSNNELVNFWIEPGHKPDNVTIPETIGPYGISSIGSGSFNDNCDLVKITIPASVTSIGDGAFKGCHNLQTVIYTDASTIQSIGNDAFKTQEVTCQCTLATPELTFVGAMINDGGGDTVPFIYAMNGVSNINNANQNKTWITCHSGWPTNLEVQYQFDPLTQTGEAQLIGYPRFELIDDPAKAEAWVDTLPYVTAENRQEYVDIVKKATAYYKDPEHNPQPTENEMAIVNSTLNVVVPTSVDSIKDGLFSGYTYDETTGEKVPVSGITPDQKIQTIVLNGVKELEPYTFKDCTSLREAAVIGPEYIDNYAFDDCTALETVTLGTNLADTGKRPFSGCDALVNVNCMDSDFMYNNGVLYRNTPEGVEIVQCLESRGAVGGIGSYSVGPDELAGVTKMKQEAFEDCDGVGKVDLTATTVDVIPERAFADTDDLNSVVLPDTVKNIETEAFRDSNIRLLTIPGNQAYIAPDAFANGEYLQDKENNKDKQQTIIFECIEGNTADRYAKETEYWYINPEYGKVFLEHTVFFWDYPNYPDTSTKELFHKVKVKDGEDAVPPLNTPDHTGYQFSRWTDYTNITKDTDVYPVFGYNVYAVQFLDWDGTQIGETQYIEEGKSATPPADPTRDGHTFLGWSKDWNNVTEDRTITATYSDNSGNANRHTVTFYDYDGNIHSQQEVDHGGAPVLPRDPVKAGYTFLGWTPSDFTNVTQDMTIMSRFEKIVETNEDKDKDDDDKDKDKDKDDNKNPSATPEPRRYTVSVSGGSGSGQYEAGQIVAINAFDRGEGQNFEKWTTSTAGVGFANPNAVSTTFTMPAANVAITATYKTGGGTTSSGNTGGGGGSTGGSSTAANNGTTVQITKPGISNTGMAGATVNGSTDNFIVKVTENQNATDAVVAALQAKYGDISRIKYQAMDISLYDSTGRTKIADTSGISVNVTLPLPDDLIQYAGNNKVAAVNGGYLEDLTTRFTTVGGVPCVSFTASHFSPYVIYVDTANLTQGTIDSTPQTGDPIHPKWFLAVGLASVSLILFFKRDKTTVKTKLA